MSAAFVEVVRLNIMDYFWIELGRHCRRTRLDRGLGLNQFAKLISIDRSQISRFENGRRTMGSGNISLVLEYLNIKLGFYTVKKLEQAITCPRCLHRIK